MASKAAFIDGNEVRSLAVDLPERNRKLRLAVTLGFILFEADPRLLAEIVPDYYSIRYFFIATLMAVSAVLFPRSFRQGLGSVRWVWLLGLMAAYQLVSCLWSPSLAEGAFFGLCFLAMVPSVIALGWRLDLREIIHCYLRATLVMGVAGAVVAVAWPSIGQEQQFLLVGDWRGLANQKNLFGYYNALAASLLLLRLTSLNYAVYVPLSRGKSLLMLAFFIILANLSGSRGAMAIAFIVVLVPIVLAVPMKRSQWLTLLLLFAGAAFVTLASAIDISSGEMTLFGTQINTSNRLTLWLYGIRSISGNELFGVGRSGFWTEGREHEFLVVNNWVLTNFHNAYLTTLMEGGIIGLGLLVSTMIVMLQPLLVAYTRHGQKDTVIAIAVLMSFFVYCMVEAVIGRTTTMAAFFTFLVVMSVTSSYRRLGNSSRRGPSYIRAI